MAHEGGEEEDRSGGDEVHNERERLVQPQTYLHFRQRRAPRQASRCTVILTLFKIIFCSLGLWGHRAWNYIPRVLFITICAAQNNNNNNIYLLGANSTLQFSNAPYNKIYYMFE